MANDSDKAEPESPPGEALAAPRHDPAAPGSPGAPAAPFSEGDGKAGPDVAGQARVSPPGGERSVPGWPRRLWDWLLLRQAVNEARQAETPLPPERIAMLHLARDYVLLADGLVDASDDTPVAPVLSLYREAVFLLVAVDWTGKKALSVAYETAPESLLAEAAAADPSLARVRHLLAMHAALTPAAPGGPEQRDLVQMTRSSVRVMLEGTDPSRSRRLLRRGRWRLGVAAGLVALGLLGLASAVVAAASPTDLAAGRPWRTSSTLQAAYTAKILFHTNEEPHPWFEIDLGEPKTVRRLLVRNRSDVRWERAIPLVVELSEDRSDWQPVAKRESPFLVWEPAFPAAKARFVRLRVPRTTALHLEQIRVY